VTPDSKSLRASEVAKLCGVSTDTLRHYERLGLLAAPKRTAAGYRQYSAAAVARVQLVRRAVGLGFSLGDLARVLRVRDVGGAPCSEVRALAAGRLAQIEEEIQTLTDLRDHLRRLLANWDERLQRTPKGVRAGLLEIVLTPSQKERSNENDAVSAAGVRRSRLRAKR